MKYFLAKIENANTEVTIYDEEKTFCECIEITEQEALKLLYEEVDPMADYSIDDYKLIHSESLGRYGIAYK